MNNNPAKYLDQILKIVSKQFGKQFSLQEIQNDLTPMEIFGEKGTVIFSADLLVDSQHAIDYLERQNLVIYDNINGKVSLTFEGYMKIRTKGFAADVSEKKINLWLQRIAWTIPLIISAIALWFSLSKESTIMKNEDCRINKNIIIPRSPKFP